MSKTPVVQNLRPFISVLLMIATLLSLVFCKMEVRRLGYSLLRESRIEKQTNDQLRLQNIAFLRLTRPDRIESLAQSRLALNKAGRGQVFQVAGQVLVAQ